MRLRKRYLPLVALLGVTVAVLPSVASSSTTASITAVDPYAWTAGGAAPAEVAITPGGTVSFAYPSGAREHYPVLQSAPAGASAPECSGLPTGGALAKPASAIPATPGWSGSCKFTQAGTYEFWCGIHGALMKSYIYVNASGTVPVKTPPPPPPPPAEEEITTTTTTTTSPSITTTTTTRTTSPTPTTTASAPASTVSTSSQAGGGTGAELSTVLTPPSLTLARAQKGSTVRGVTVIAAADRGAHLEVDVLARGATLAAVKRSSGVRIGRYVRASVPVGKLSFAVALNAKAKRALRRHGHLAVTVREILTPAHGDAVSVTRSVTLKR